MSARVSLVLFVANAVAILGLLAVAARDLRTARAGAVTTSAAAPEAAADEGRITARTTLRTGPGGDGVVALPALPPVRARRTRVGAPAAVRLADPVPQQRAGVDPGRRQRQGLRSVGG